MKTHNRRDFILVTLVSLFLQIIHWLIYSWTSFSAGLLFLTPLVLCALYHAYQADTTENRGLSRLQVFLAGVVIPFVLSILVTIAMYVHNPDLTIFHPMAVQERNAAEYVMMFAGRLTITSFYLLVFAWIDIPLQHFQERHKERKQDRRGSTS